MMWFAHWKPRSFQRKIFCSRWRLWPTAKPLRRTLLSWCTAGEAMASRHQGEGCLYFWRLCVNDDGRKATLRQARNSGVAIDSTSLAMLPNVPELEADPLSDQRKCPKARRASSVEWYTCHGSPCVTQGSSDCAFLLLFAPDFASLAGAARPDGSWCWLQF